jgi:type I site-specific restriction endonuclease
MRQYSAALDRMTPRQLYQYRRQRTLELLLKQRKLVKEFPDVDILRKMLRSAQKRLLVWRTEYRTGTKAGHA